MQKFIGTCLKKQERPYVFKKSDYTLRIDNYGKKEVEKFLKEHTKGYVIGEEKSDKENKLHCHCVFEAYDDVKKIRTDIKTYFEIGNGNAQNRCYSLTKIRSTVRKAVSYSIKGKDFIQGYVCPKQMQVCIKMAHGKGLISFKKELEALDEKLMAGKISKRRYYDKFIDLKIDYNQKPIQRHIKNHCILMFCKQDVRYRQMLKDAWWSEFMPDEE